MIDTTEQELPGTTYFKVKACLGCNLDRIHEIRCYLVATDTLRLYHFRCLTCGLKGEE